MALTCCASLSDADVAELVDAIKARDGGAFAAALGVPLTCRSKRDVSRMPDTRGP